MAWRQIVGYISYSGQENYYYNSGICGVISIAFLEYLV